VIEASLDSLLEYFKRHLRNSALLLGIKACLQLSDKSHVDLLLVEEVHKGDKLVEKLTIFLLESSDELVTGSRWLSHVAF
jgi:hypothetical protein